MSSTRRGWASPHGLQIVTAGVGLALLAFLIVDRRRHDAQLADLRARLDTLSSVAAGRSAPREPKPQMTWQAMRDGYGRVFDSSSPDTLATERARTEVWSKLVRALPTGSVVRSFECRELMCRLETSHVDLVHYKTFMVTAFQNPLTRIWRTEVTSMPLGDDETPSIGPQMVSFIAREGHSLPSLTD
jgi:hypothetical protein